jgi:hypothetical protein
MLISLWLYYMWETGSGQGKGKGREREERGKRKWEKPCRARFLSHFAFPLPFPLSSLSLPFFLAAGPGGSRLTFALFYGINV